MNIKINKDFLTEYRNEFWKGFTVHELVYMATGGVFGAATAALLYFKFHMEITLSIYAGIPAAFPVIMFGFYKYQGYLPVCSLLSELLYTYRSMELYHVSSEECIKTKIFFIRKRRKR